jgi:DNA-binding MarR family transcriptional regulator
VSDRRGLNGLLSALLVAYTIEFDGEFERLMPHGTTLFGAGGPEPGVSRTGKQFGRTWLVSQAMWSNGMRFVSTDGIPAATMAALPVNFNGLQRWRYLYCRPDPGAADDARLAESVIRPTRDGMRAQAIWSALDGVVDLRWQDRFGAGLTGGLRESLRAVADQIAAEADGPMPFYLPVVGYGDGMRTRRDHGTFPPPVFTPGESDLSVLLSRVLLAFTLDYEAASKLSLAIGANVLRVLNTAGVRLPEISALTGVSKEAVQASVGFLERHDCLTVGSEPAGRRGKVVALTERGMAAQAKWRRVSAAVENGWRDRFGTAVIDQLSRLAAEMLAHQTGDRATLGLGLVPYGQGWRGRPPYLSQSEAYVRDPGAALPHHPTVLHRGGYPDGA